MTPAEHELLQSIKKSVDKNLDHSVTIAEIRKDVNVVLDDIEDIKQRQRAIEEALPSLKLVSKGVVWAALGIIGAGATLVWKAVVKVVTTMNTPPGI